MLRSSSDKDGEEEKKSPVSLEVKGIQAISRKQIFRSFICNIPSQKRQLTPVAYPYTRMCCFTPLVKNSVGEPAQAMSVMRVTEVEESEGNY
jgi:hypothetical protein